MREQPTTQQSLDVFLRALQGQNFSPKTVRAYGDDLRQFVSWLQENRVDFENPRRMGKEDVEGSCTTQNLTGVSRARKLAAIRKFFIFLKEAGTIPTNPAAAVRGARREEKEPTILYKEQYKANSGGILPGLYHIHELNSLF